MAELRHLSRQTVGREHQHLVELPEKVVQFGTGAFLRGFVEYFIDEANRHGVFGGRIVAIGSTDSGRDRKLNQQDGLYTIAVRGVEAGVVRSEYRLIASLSRAVSATTEWPAALACAHNPALELIFSNTTETGIRLDDADTATTPVPRSFPGKLTRFLLERARHFDFAPAAGLVVLPCELIENNGDRLGEIVLTHAQRWSVERRFVPWLEQSVVFCNTLVDRIVPGEPEQVELERAWHELGYRDDLLTVCEPYRLYAIEADAAAAQRLTFAAVDSNVIVTHDITPYRERKLRLLNGTHTITVPAALLAGCETVAEALADEHIGAFIRRVLFTELVPGMSTDGAEAFGNQVLDRFSNPYIRHALLDITLQQTMKLRVRVVPAILDYAARVGRVPSAIAFGFAAYLWYVREMPEARLDEQAAAVRELWAGENLDLHGVARSTCSNQALWGADLTTVPGFAEAVGAALHSIAHNGIRSALDQQLSARAEV